MDGKRFEHFSLRWNNFHNNMKTGFHELLKEEDLVDVTIAVEGKLIQAHKMVLSVCSPYFKNIFKSNPCQHPVVFLKDVSQKELSGILQFMYLGEVSVQQEELGKFLETAEALQIKGLTGEDECEEKKVPTPSIQKEESTGGKLTVRNKIIKPYQDDPPDKPSSSIGVKRQNTGSPSQEINKKSKQSPPPLQPALPQVEPNEVEISDGESDRTSIKDELHEQNECISQLLDENAELDVSLNSLSNNSSLSGDILNNLPALPNHSFGMDDTKQEIRFVMSQRMRPCLVYNNYLYIKDHVGVALPGQTKTIYWRCKDVSCKARCIQTDFRFRLKRNTFHQHLPNIDKSYLPINVEKAYDIIRYLN